MGGGTSPPSSTSVGSTKGARGQLVSVYEGGSHRSSDNTRREEIKRNIKIVG